MARQMRPMKSLHPIKLVVAMAAAACLGFLVTVALGGGNTEVRISALEQRVEQIREELRGTHSSLALLISQSKLEITQRLDATKKDIGELLEDVLRRATERDRRILVPPEDAEVGSLDGVATKMPEKQEGASDQGEIPLSSSTAAVPEAFSETGETSLRESRPETASASRSTNHALKPSEHYALARDMMQRGDYAAAERLFKLLLEQQPDHDLAANAAYWLAETHYSRNDFEAAANAFARNYETYGADSPKAADNLLKLGMALQALGEEQAACQRYAQLAAGTSDLPAYVERKLARQKESAKCR